MRNFFSLAIILMACFLHSLFAEESNKEPELPTALVKAEKHYQDELIKLREEYLKDVQKEQERLLKVIDRELNRLRLSDEDKEMAKKISEAKDEKVKAALLSVANEKVKASLPITNRRETLLSNEAVYTDMLGNLIEPKDYREDKQGGSLAERLSEGTWYRKGSDTESYDFREGGVVVHTLGERVTNGTWAYDTEKKVVTMTWGKLSQTIRQVDRRLVLSSRGESTTFEKHTE